MTNELVILDEKKLLAPEKLFTPKAMDQVLKDITDKAKAFVPDMSTEKGRKAIASMAYQVSRTKTFLDEKGLSLTAGWAAQKKLVDLERNKIKSTLDNLRDEVRAPLDEWEDANEKRINERKERIVLIEEAKNFSTGHSLEVVQNAIKGLATLIEFDWQEFSVKAKNCHDESLDILVKVEAQIKVQLAEKEELDKLRLEKEEREKKDRDARIAQEAADKVRIDAENKAKAEKIKVEQDKIDAANASKAREDKIEADKKKAVQDKIDAEARAKDAINKGKIAAARATTIERQKVAAKKLADDQAAAAREADEKHHALINNEAMKSILAIIAGTEDYSFLAKNIVTAIAKGRIQ